MPMNGIISGEQRESIVEIKKGVAVGLGDLLGSTDTFEEVLELVVNRPHEFVKTTVEYKYLALNLGYQSLHWLFLGCTRREVEQ